MFMIHRPGAGDLETPVKRRILLPYLSSSALHVKEIALWLASATWNECPPSDRRQQKRDGSNQSIQFFWSQRCIFFF